MTVRELINILSNYNENQRVLLYSHGACSVEEQDEVIDAIEEDIYDDNDNIVETVVSLTSY